MDDSVLGAVDVGITMPDAISRSMNFTPSEVAPLAGFLDAHNQGDTDKLSQIADFFRGDKKEFSDIDLLQAVRHLEVKLGTPNIGERRIDKVYQYVKLQRQIDDLGRERDTLLR